MENLTNTKRKNKKVLIGLVIIIVACVATYFIGNAIYDSYQQNQINNRYEKSQIIDKEMKKLGYKKNLLNTSGFAVKKETDSKTYVLLISIRDFNIYSEDLELSDRFTIRYSSNTEDNVFGEYGISNKTGQELYTFINSDGSEYCAQAIPVESGSKDDLCSKQQIKEINKVKKAYNQLKKDIDATDEEIATWAAWRISEKYKAEQ